MEELEESLKEFQEGREKDEDDLREMRLENLSLSKEYAKSLDFFRTGEIFLSHRAYLTRTSPF